jgi:hypothetical protein
VVDRESAHGSPPLLAGAQGDRAHPPNPTRPIALVTPPTTPTHSPITMAVQTTISPIDQKPAATREIQTEQQVSRTGAASVGSR